nr:SRPBCC family protein [Micromonospora sp. DSM 115978]
MIDIITELAAAHRAVANRTGVEGEVIGVVLRRRYPAAIEDVWDALTDPDRLSRWFLPVSGDLRVGGKFQLEGNVGGEILSCEAPTLLRATWGGPASVVQVRLTADAGDTALELEHTVPLAFAGSGAGALFVGPGWDITILALARFLRGEVVADPVAWENTDEVQRYSARTIEAWSAAVEASGTATAEEIAGGVAAARAQFTPALPNTD